MERNAKGEAMTDRELIECLATARPEELGELIKTARRKIRRPPDVLDILLDKVCKKHRVSVTGVKSTKRHNYLVDARVDFAKKAVTYRFTYKQIAHKLGRTNHATIINYLKNHNGTA